PDRPSRLRLERRSHEFVLGGGVGAALRPNRRAVGEWSFSPTQVGKGRHRWRRNPESSPQVEARWRVIAMGGEMTVPRVPNTAASDVCAASAMQDENDRHRWRRNPESSPQVEQRWQGIGTGGEMSEPRVPYTAASEDCDASAMQDEND